MQRRYFIELDNDLDEVYSERELLNAIQSLKKKGIWKIAGGNFLGVYQNLIREVKENRKKLKEI